MALATNDKSGFRWAKRFKRTITLVEGLDPTKKVTKAQKRSINYLLETATVDETRRNRGERKEETAKDDAAPTKSQTY